LKGQYNLALVADCMIAPQIEFINNPNELLAGGEISLEATLYNLKLPKK